MNVSPLTVFISSSVYNLVDLRAELGAYLTSHGFQVRRSESVESGFFVDPTSDAIETCLANVRSSDCIVCIIDGRHGADLGAKYGAITATAKEIEEARSGDKKILYFIRSIALNEYQQLRQNDGFATSWVERNNHERAIAWKNWLASLFDLPNHRSRNTWFDTFTSIVDLKQSVLKRLAEHFPIQTVANALRPERVVRMSFRPRSHNNNMSPVKGRFLNVGVGPAVNLRLGVVQRETESLQPFYTLGGLTEGGYIADGEQDMAFDASFTGQGHVIATCEYENRFGDAYRVERTFTQSESHGSLMGYGPEGDERFYVGLKDASGIITWTKIR